MRIETNSEYYLTHFAERLKDRYGIEITPDEYFELCKQPIDLIYNVSPNKRFGSLKIKEVDVLVIRCNAAKLLNTCVPATGRLPMPLRYKRMGKQYEDFENDYIAAHKRINKLVQWLTDHENDNEYKRTFFVEKPFGYKDWEYGAALAKFRQKHLFTSVGVVKNICREQLKSA